METVELTTLKPDPGFVVWVLVGGFKDPLCQQPYVLVAIDALTFQF
jgi:hypothetical protein